jgi:hypothetical protein
MFSASEYRAMCDKLLDQAAATADLNQRAALINRAVSCSQKAEAADGHDLTPERPLLFD